MPQPEEDPRSRSRGAGRRISFVLLFASLSVVLFLQRDVAWIPTLLAKQTQLLKLLHAHPLPMLAVGFALYVLVTGLSLPGAALLTLFIGYLLQQAWPDAIGLISAIILVSFASTAGASCAFLLARYLFRATVTRRLGPRLRRFNDALQSEGPFYLFALRLIPVVPFFVINIAMGLTPVRLGTFWWVSQLGMLPGTIAYIMVGASLPDVSVVQQRGIGSLLRWELILAFAIIGLLPIAARVLVTWWRRREANMR